MAKWWCVASLLLCLAVATVAARSVPAAAGDDCHTVALEARRDAAGFDEAKTAFGGSTDGDGGLFGGSVNGGPLGSGIAGFGPHGGFGDGGGPFGGFGGGFGAGGGGGGGGGGGVVP